MNDSKKDEIHWFFELFIILIILCSSHNLEQFFLWNLNFKGPTLIYFWKWGSIIFSLYHIHQGMVSAAEYIRRKLRDDNILTRAFGFDTARGTQVYDLVLVGHSLGAGTAAILAILLKQEHPNLSCFAYSPPGGLLRWYIHTIYSSNCSDFMWTVVTSLVHTVI